MATLDVVNRGSGAVTLELLAGRETALLGDGVVDGGVLVLRLAQLDAAGGGAITLRTAAGGITVAGSGVLLAGGGNLVIDAGGDDAGLRLEAAVQLGEGRATLSASGGLTTLAEGRITLAGTGALTLRAGGDIALGADVRAGGGLVTVTAGGALHMASGTEIVSSGGSDTDARRIVIEAAGDATLSRLRADASLAVGSQGGRLLDGLVGDGPNLVAPTARLVAAGGMGSEAAALRLALDTLSLDNRAGAVFLHEADGLALARGGLVNGDGLLSLRLQAGSLVLDQAVSSTGGARFETLAAGADIVVGAAVTGEGPLTLVAADAVQMLAGSRLQVRGTAGLEVTAGGVLQMAADARLVSAGGAQRLASGGDVLLGQVAAASGAVRIDAGGALLDANGASTNITAGSARLTAQDGIGSAANPLETSLALLAAGTARGGVFIAEANGLEIGRIDVLEGARGGSNADVRIEGGLTHAGHFLVSQAVRAEGSGALLPLVINAAVGSGSGAVQLVSAGGIELGSGGVVGTGGALTLRAEGGSLLGSGGHALSGGTLRAEGGSLLGSGGHALSGGSVSLSAAGDIGSAGTALRVAAGTVDAQAGGGVFLASPGALARAGGRRRCARAVGCGAAAGPCRDPGQRHAARRSGGARRRRRGRRGRAAPGARGRRGRGPCRRRAGARRGRAAAARRRGLGDRRRRAACARRRGRGHAGARGAAGIGLAEQPLVIEAGTLQLQAGAAGAFVRGAGDLLLSGHSAGALVVQATGTLGVNAALAATGALRLAGAGLVLTADVDGGSAVTLQSAGALTLGAALRAGGSVFMDAAGAGLAFAAAGSVQAGADVRLAAAQSLLLGRVATPGTLALQAGQSIHTLDGAVLQAQALRAVAGDAIGSAEARLETTAGTLAARAGAGGLWLRTADARASASKPTAASRPGPRPR